MAYEENRSPEINVLKEVVCSWIFAAGLVGVVFVVFGLVH